MKKVFLIPLLLIFTLFIAKGSVWALQCQLDFDAETSPLNGFIYYEGDEGPLYGTNHYGYDIKLNSVTGVTTPVQQGVTLDLEGILDFHTGDLIYYTSGPTTTQMWQFGGGGSLRLDGTIPPQDPSVGDPFSGTNDTLLEGTFDGVQIVTADSVLNYSFTGFGTVQINQDLLAYYGLPFQQYNFEITISAQEIGNFNPFTGAFEGGITDVKVATTCVPEPATIILLGTSLIGLAGLGRKKLIG